MAFGEAVLIAVPYSALPAIAKDVGADLKGKVVIDPNNPVPSRDGEMAAQAKERGAAVSTAAMFPGRAHLSRIQRHQLYDPPTGGASPATAARRSGRRGRPPPHSSLACNWWRTPASSRSPSARSPSRRFSISARRRLAHARHRNSVRSSVSSRLARCASSLVEGVKLVGSASSWLLPPAILR